MICSEVMIFTLINLNKFCIETIKKNVFLKKERESN